MIRSLLGFAAFSIAVALATVSGGSATIIDDWSTVQTPTPPPLKAVTVDPATTALLVLDWIKPFCTAPQCLATVPNVAKALQGARNSHTMVVYSLGGNATRADILPSVAPVGDEPIVTAGPDKFLGTNLEQILTSKGIKTVIVTGFAAEGAAMYTASHAALIGMKVIVPVDGMASNSPYAMQYVAWNLSNAPRVGAAVTLTTADRITY